MEKSSEIFRDKMVEKLNKPKSIDELVSLNLSLGWVTLLVIIGLFGVFLFWAFFAEVTTTVKGRGILVYSGNMVGIVAQEEGYIYDISVVAGQTLKQDQTMARIYNYNQYLDTRQILMQMQNAQNAADYLHSTEEFRLANLEGAYNSEVVAPARGKVLSVLKNKMDYVKKGEKIAIFNIMAENNAMQAKAYFSTADGKKIPKGAEVRIDLDNVEVGEYGYLIGKVESVSSYPVEQELLAAELGSGELGRNLTADLTPPLLHVVVSLIPADTPSGYLWTGKRGPQETIESGSTLHANIVIRREHPAEIAFKWLNTIFYGGN